MIISAQAIEELAKECTEFELITSQQLLDACKFDSLSVLGINPTQVNKQAMLKALSANCKELMAKFINIVVADLASKEAIHLKNELHQAKSEIAACVEPDVRCVVVYQTRNKKTLEQIFTDPFEAAAFAREVGGRVVYQRTGGKG